MVTDRRLPVSQLNRLLLPTFGRPTITTWGMGMGARKDMETTRKVTLGVLGVVAMAAGVLLVRTQKQPRPKDEPAELVQAGETVPGILSLERIRELGI